MDNIRIQNAPARYADEILAQCYATYEEHRKEHPFAFPKNGFDILMKPGIVAAFVDDKGRQVSESPVVLAATKGDEMVGYVILSNWAQPGGANIPYVNVIDIYVQPEHRRRGIATRMMEEIKLRAHHGSWGNLKATVWFGNAASEALFNTVGFTPMNTSYRFGSDAQAQDWPESAESGTPSWYWSALMLAVSVFLLCIAYLLG